jgi:hypothetical protein
LHNLKSERDKASWKTKRKLSPPPTILFLCRFTASKAIIGLQKKSLNIGTRGG